MDTCKWFLDCCINFSISKSFLRNSVIFTLPYYRGCMYVYFKFIWRHSTVIINFIYMSILFNILISEMVFGTHRNRSHKIGNKINILFHFKRNVKRKRKIIYIYRESIYLYVLYKYNITPIRTNQCHFVEN